MNDTQDKKVAVCWSSGKDSCLALYRLLQENKDVVCLVSMISAKDARSHAHGINLKILECQAEALGIRIQLVDSAGDYEQSLVDALKQIKEELGVEQVAFGSLYADEDRKWNEKVSNKAGIEPLFPTWISPEQSNDLLEDFLSLGFTAVICRASEKHFEHTWPGRILDSQFYKEVQKKGICVMGEYGEYHTFVVDGPIFKKKVELTQSGVVLNSGLGVEPAKLSPTAIRKKSKLHIQ
ncbi:diphthine--ammonia ligase [Bacillus sp. Marseille-Q1617]|uniref:Dph6-related ATP pyrophosphatase n=1 Tax=Bacillus sp. Marseille-Q1617 TaxID=2736887 RepID=UPI00158A8C9B|nr:diphthine--ammonia ligase [Bacillus sp. Marseille-Q1617]